MFGNVSSLSARYCIRLTSAAKKPLRMIPDRISPSVLSRPGGRRGRKSAPARRGRRKGRGHHQQTADAQQDRQRAAEGGAGGHPDDVRIHQRVLEHALQGGAAQPQRAPASRPSPRAAGEPTRRSARSPLHRRQMDRCGQRRSGLTGTGRNRARRPRSPASPAPLPAPAG